jgi:hypothetical protein
VNEIGGLLTRLSNRSSNLNTGKFHFIEAAS